MSATNPFNDRRGREQGIKSLANDNPKSQIEKINYLANVVLLLRSCTRNNTNDDRLLHENAGLSIVLKKAREIQNPEIKSIASAQTVIVRLVNELGLAPKPNAPPRPPPPKVHPASGVVMRPPGKSTRSGPRPAGGILLDSGPTPS